MSINNITVVGLDVAKSSVVACVLNSPINDGEVRTFYYHYDFLHFDANLEGINRLLEINPTVAILEPTGTRYSKIWASHLSRIGAEVRFVDHKTLKQFRTQHLGCGADGALARGVYRAELVHYHRRRLCGRRLGLR